MGFPDLMARVNAVAFDRVKNRVVTIGGGPVDVIWDEPYSESVGIASSNPMITLPTATAKVLGIVLDSEGQLVVSGLVTYRIATVEPDEEGMTRCELRRA